MILAIIQARMGSTRLPGKIVKPILGRPMLAQMLLRVKRAKKLDQIIVATTDNLEDDETEKLVKECGVGVFRGSEKDVLDRFYQTAKSVGAKSDTAIVVLLADCPLQDPAVIDEAVEHFTQAVDPFAYAGTVLNYPEGLDFNIFTFSALEEAAKNAKLPSEREHVTRYFINRPDRFRAIQWKTGKRDDSGMHWSVDTLVDFEFVTKIFEHLYPTNPDFGKDEVLALLERHPELLGINKGGTGYEGLAKSLKEDEEFKEKIK
ncbi:MAG: glycosyltransferase family protein [Candidatus Paceibacterota bacterium]|jgi:spore coat polysaccharide biosynthesis protein SpsF